MTERFISGSDVFQPLFEVTRDPTSHPELHIFLQRVVGFDSVDDESKPERRLYRKFPTARMWNTSQSPPYSYWRVFANYNCTRGMLIPGQALLHVREHGESERLAAVERFQ